MMDGSPDLFEAGEGIGRRQVISWNNNLRVCLNF